MRRQDIAAEILELPFPTEDFKNLQKEICYWEAARIVRDAPGIRIVPELEALLAPYARMDVSAYSAARRRADAYRAAFDDLCDRADVILMPAAAL